jgi:hypothetical protein
MYLDTDNRPVVQACTLQPAAVRGAQLAAATSPGATFFADAVSVAWVLANTLKYDFSALPQFIYLASCIIIHIQHLREGAVGLRELGRLHTCWSPSGSQLGLQAGEAHCNSTLKVI